MKLVHHMLVLFSILGVARTAQANVLPLIQDGSISVEDDTKYSVRTDYYYGGISRYSIGNESRVAMEFDLTGLEEPASAFLTMCHLDGDAIGSLHTYPDNGTITTSDYDGTWVEDVGGIPITMSASLGPIGGPSGYHFGYGITFDTDVTNALSMAYDRGWSSIGFLLTHSSPSGRVFALDGSNPNYWTAGSPPSLGYTPTPEPVTLRCWPLAGWRFCGNGSAPEKLQELGARWRTGMGHEMRGAYPRKTATTMYGASSGG